MVAQPAGPPRLVRAKPPLDPGRFKEGVFGGDKVEVLIQHLLIKADQEGGHERCSRAQSGSDPVGSIGRHPGPARSQRTPLSLALCPDAVAGRYAGRRQRPVLDLPLGTPAAARGAVPARPQAGALPRHVPLLLQGPYFYKALDVAATEQVLGAWAQGSRPLGTVAIDGKRLRGSAPAGHDGSEGGHVVAAFASQLGAVIGQVQVAPEADEITAALALLKSLPLAGAIITGDAAFCQRAVCQVSLTRDMSGFGSTRSVRFLPEGSHAAGGQNGPDHRCDWVASSEEVELRRGGGAVGDERAALSPAARCL